MNMDKQTCWTLVREAATQAGAQRERFARIYEPVVRCYLLARWREGPLIDHVDDSVQDVFIELFRDGGALDSADQQKGSFRAYLLGVVRNIARRVEQRRRRDIVIEGINEKIVADDTSVSTAFDQAWGRSLLGEAKKLHRELATAAGENALKRVELLQLRFQDGLPIREIARRWNQPDELIHRQYAIARKEFAVALKSVVSFQFPGSSKVEIEKACIEFLNSLKSKA